MRLGALRAAGQFDACGAAHAGTTFGFLRELQSLRGTFPDFRFVFWGLITGVLLGIGLATAVANSLRSRWFDEAVSRGEIDAAARQYL